MGGPPFGPITVKGLSMSQRVMPTAHWRRHPTIKLGKVPLIDSFATRFAALGSCFALNLKRAIEKYGFPYWYFRDVGAHYSALSLARVLERIADRRPFAEGDLYIDEAQKLVQLHPFHIRTKYYGRQAVANALAHARAIGDECRRELERCDIVVVTLGTARVFQLRANDDVMCYVQEVPADQWYSRLLGFEENLECLRSIHRSVSAIRRGRPFVMVLTVSPQRYLFSADHHQSERDVAQQDAVVDNLHSKSILLVAAHRFAEEMADQNVFYFPAYDIVIEELRLLDSISHYDFCHIHQFNTPPRVVHRFIDFFFSESMVRRIGFFEGLCDAEAALDKIKERPLADDLAAFMDRMDAILDEAEPLVSQSWKEALDKLANILRVSADLFVRLGGSDRRYFRLHDRLAAFIDRATRLTPGGR
jgi:hypothetical protein